MQPICVLIIIVLILIVFCLISSDSNPTQSVPEYYPSGATALPPSTRYADVAGPLPANPSKMIVPPRNPAFGAYERFLMRQTPERETYYQVPNPQWRYRGERPTPQDYTAWNYLANRFFPTDRNTITDTMF